MLRIASPNDKLKVEKKRVRTKCNWLHQCNNEILGKITMSKDYYDGKFNTVCQKKTAAL